MGYERGANDGLEGKMGSFGSGDGMLFPGFVTNHWAWMETLERVWKRGGAAHTRMNPGVNEKGGVFGRRGRLNFLRTRNSGEWREEAKRAAGLPASQ